MRGAARRVVARSSDAEEEDEINWYYNTPLSITTRNRQASRFKLYFQVTARLHILSRLRGHYFARTPNFSSASRYDFGGDYRAGMDEGELYLPRYTAFRWDRLAIGEAVLSLIESYTYRRPRSAVRRNLLLVNLLLPVYRVFERRIESQFSLVSRASGRAIRPRNVNVRFPVFSRKAVSTGLWDGRENDSAEPILPRGSESFSSSGISTISSWFEGLTDVCPQPMWNNDVTIAVPSRISPNLFLQTGSRTFSLERLLSSPRTISRRASRKLKVTSNGMIHVRRYGYDNDFSRSAIFRRKYFTSWRITLTCKTRIAEV